MGSEVCMHLGQVREAGQEPQHLTAQAINVSNSTDLFSKSEKFASQNEERRGIQTGVNMRHFIAYHRRNHTSFFFFFFSSSENKKLLSPSPVTMVTEDPSAQSDGSVVFSPRIACEAHVALTSKQGSDEDNPRPSLEAEMHVSDTDKRSRMAPHPSHQGPR